MFVRPRDELERAIHRAREHVQEHADASARYEALRAERVAVRARLADLDELLVPKHKNAMKKAAARAAQGSRAAEPARATDSSYLVLVLEQVELQDRLAEVEQQLEEVGRRRAALEPSRRELVALLAELRSQLQMDGTAQAGEIEELSAEIERIHQPPGDSGNSIG